MLLLSVYGEHINQVTDGYAAVKASGTKTHSINAHMNTHMNAHSIMGMATASEYRGKLNDAEEFVRVMLQVNANTATTTGIEPSLFAVQRLCVLRHATGEMHLRCEMYSLPINVL